MTNPELSLSAVLTRAWQDAKVYFGDRLRAFFSAVGLVLISWLSAVIWIGFDRARDGLLVQFTSTLMALVFWVFVVVLWQVWIAPKNIVLDYAKDVLSFRDLVHDGLIGKRGLEQLEAEMNEVVKPVMRWVALGFLLNHLDGAECALEGATKSLNSPEADDVARDGAYRSFLHASDEIKRKASGLLVGGHLRLDISKPDETRASITLLKQRIRSERERIERAFLEVGNRFR